MEGKREKGKCENEEKKEGKETKRMEKERERDRRKSSHLLQRPQTLHKRT